MKLENKSCNSRQSSALSTSLSQSIYSVVSHNANLTVISMATGQVEKSGLKQKYLYNFKMEKYQPTFIIQVFLIDIYSRKGIHLKSGVFNTASSATFTLIISIQQYNQPVAVVEIFTDVHLQAIYCILIC